MKDFYTKYNKSRVNKEFWINRQGKIIKYKGDLNTEISSFHGAIAEKILPSSTQPKDGLFKLGWVMIGSIVYHVPICYIPPSQAQINKLYDLNLYYHLTINHIGRFINYEKNKNLFN